MPTFGWTLLMTIYSRSGNSLLFSQNGSKKQVSKKQVSLIIESITNCMTLTVKTKIYVFSGINLYIINVLLIIIANLMIIVLIYYTLNKSILK